jgi:hypothetical protein
LAAGGAAPPRRGGAFRLDIDTGVPPYGAGSDIPERRPERLSGVFDARSSPIISMWHSLKPKEIITSSVSKTSRFQITKND